MKTPPNSAETIGITIATIALLNGLLAALLLFLTGCATTPTLDYRAPDGTRITQHGPAALPAVITTTSPGNTTLTLTGPAAFSAPTPAQKASGILTYIFYIGIALGIAIAGYGLGWGGKILTAGGLSLAAGCAIAQFANAFPLATALLALSAAAILAGPYIWSIVSAKPFKPWASQPA
jgi:hypothetical protein